MVERPNGNAWGFIVDTDQYSGNFERQLVAYMTGQYGECGVGEELVPTTPLESFEESVMHVMGDDGCSRPASIWPTPGYANDGRGNHYVVNDENPARWPAYQSVICFFHERPTEAEIEEMKNRAENFSEMGFKYISPFRILGYRLAQFTATETYHDA